MTIEPRNNRRSGLMAMLLVAGLTVPATPLYGRDNLGLYSDWGAFRDSLIPRCYAIAKAIPSTLRRDYEPYAAIGTWPKRSVRNQLHLRMSRKLAASPQLTLRIGEKRFELTGGGGDAWAADRKINAAIIAAMRSATRMTVSARGADGKRFSNSWNLPGAASAMDASAIGCARLR